MTNTEMKIKGWKIVGTRLKENNKRVKIWSNPSLRLFAEYETPVAKQIQRKLDHPS